MTDQPAMTIDDVIRDFGSAGYVLPRAAMQWALNNWAVAAPRFVEVLSRYAEGTDRSQPTENALLFIIHLLGEKSDTAAFPSLCRLLRDKQAPDLVLGDAITTTLPRILISTYNGDIGTLRSVIEDAATDDFVLDAAFLSMAYLTRVGRIPEADTHAYLRHLLTAMQPQGENYRWVGWTECVAALGFADFAPDVQRLFERGFVDDSVMEYRHFEDDLKLTLDDPERMAGLADKGLSPFTGAIDELGGWYGFSEQSVRDEALRAERQAALARQAGAHRQPSGSGERNPWRNVGRNDPCPCGSGLKFKKCCLGKPDSERPALTGLRAA